MRSATRLIHSWLIQLFRPRISDRLVQIMDRFDICIAGAGVVGLAIAHRLLEAFPKASIVLTEQESTFGQHTSSRLSEVIHAGIYYPPGSLKARLCVEGKEALYAFCDKYRVPYRRIGKLICRIRIATKQSRSLRKMPSLTGLMIWNIGLRIASKSRSRQSEQCTGFTRPVPAYWTLTSTCKHFSR